MPRRDDSDDESESSYSEGSELLDTSDIDEDTVAVESHIDDGRAVASDSESESEDEEVEKPTRSKAADSNKIREREKRPAGRAAPARTRSGDHGERRRALPARSKSGFEERPKRGDLGYGKQRSERSLGGPRMRREGSQKQLVTQVDRDSNRARRLRAVGQGPARCQLLRRSQSFSNRSSNAKLLVDSDHVTDREHDDAENSARGERKTPSRSNSGISITDGERQYARTAARGITRCKSLRGQKVDIDGTSKSVASKLQALGARSEHTPRISSGSRPQRNARESSSKEKETNEEEAASNAETKSAEKSPDSPKAVATGLAW